MAIEPMRKIGIAVAADEGPRMLSELRALGCVQITAEPDSALPGARPPRAEMAGIAVRIQELTLSLEVIDSLAPAPASFFSKLVSVPLMTQEAELEQALAETPVELIYRDAVGIHRSTKEARHRMDEIAREVREYTPWAFLDTPLERLRPGHWTRLAFVQVSARRWPAIEAELQNQSAFVYEAQRAADAICVCLAAKSEDEAALLALLAALGMAEIAFPNSPLNMPAYLAQLAAERETCAEKLAAGVEEAVVLAGFRRALRIVLGHWESRRREVESRDKSFVGSWTHVVSGYARARDVAALEQLIALRFPGATLDVQKPGTDEDVPVLLNLPRMVRPISFLVHMYGLPRYTDFDPSAFLMMSFYIFFGICFSDVGYGALLIALSLYIARKNRGIETMENFAMLFFYSGVSTVIFGAMLGAWFGDLFQERYIGAGNPLIRLRETFQLFDPMSKPVVALVMALGIGMINQLYGIAIKMYDSIRQGDLAAAVFDGLLWLITLPAMAVLISMLFVSLPAWLATAATLIFAGGAIGLVLTQGRGESTLTGKAVVGVVSLYGIVGSYGCTAFIGDTLSYCRLLALGLTTGIVAMSINLMASMLSEIPYAGPVLGVALLTGGHLFNFIISLLGAFIHSARLIFVEFFGRFYTGGGKPFQPLGIDSASIKVSRPEKSAVSSN
ncbi:MAG: hypothetical protein HYV27_01885 [Candidatus Hydrogenedentes bacterium]|nr:hypothetical protein [Candidatus Hydrogenedentota bacterium]